MKGWAVALLVLAGVAAVLASKVFGQPDAGASGDGSSPGGWGVGNVPNLGPNEIASVASNAGFSGDDLAIAIAVALAESGGNQGAYNPEIAAGTPEGKGSYGLWQIYTKVHPEFDAQQLVQDPQYNANAAYQIYSEAGFSFRPWSTFKNGAYLAHMEVAQAAAGSV